MNKKLASSRMIIAILLVQFFSVICISLLKYNMDVFSNDYRESEAKYQKVLFDLEDISRSVYLHENYVTNHFLTYNEEMHSYYEAEAYELQIKIEEDMMECRLEIEDLDDGEEIGVLQNVSDSLTAYFNCSDIAFTVSRNEDLEICEFLNNYYLEYYASSANSSVLQLEDDIMLAQNVIKQKMQTSMSAIKLAFVLGVTGILIATIVCMGYCYKLLKLQDKYMQEAETASQAKTKFLSNMSHEIRTPINTVIGLNEMILRGPENAVAVAGYARDVKSAGNMLLSLVNSILDLSKIEAGLMELSPVEYDLASLLNDVRSIVKPKFDAKNLDFIIDVSENLPSRMYGDDIRIRQILINLLTNSCKYTDKGYVKLSVYGEMDNGMTHLEFIVRDTGIGMKPEDLQKLSTRFARFDEKRNRSVEGTGIGMDITNSFLKMMDSWLNVESEYGKGSKFSFYLQQKIVDDTPVGNLSEAFENAAVDQEYEASFIAPKAKVLVVDDNAMNLNVFTGLLKETEIQIQTAGGGMEALNFTASEKYDLIFMDHMMPGMDGIETRNRIASQEDGLNRETKIIALTANALSGAKEEYAKLGFNNFLAKPIQPDKLESMVKEMLPQELLEASSRKKKTAAVDTDGLPRIDGVDNEYAVSHNGSADAVIGAMKTFKDMAVSEKNALQGFYGKLQAAPDDDAALTDYRIKVHSMKSSAGLIGALQVYGAAAHLEYEAKQKNVQAVLDVTPYFLNFWDKLAADVKAYFQSIEPEDSGNKKAEDGEAFKNLLLQLIPSMQNYDIKGSDSVISRLEEYSLSEDEQKLFDEIKSCVTNLDAPKCEELCRKWLDMIK